MARPKPIQIAACGFRTVVPEILPQCRNCAHFAFDSDDRMSRRGELVFLKTKLRCSLHGFSVQMATVCDHHSFKRADRSDA